MTARAFDQNDEAPTVEVRVWRHGELVHTELCESEEQAALILEEWQELDGVRCEVDDLSVRHHPGDVLEPGAAEPWVDDHQEQAGEGVVGASRYVY
ncbi:MAG TPA: hypothetical protein VFH56_12445 [Acidimicrobiales bacterium]|nr:hypothetical protein [Acidimicrobiales bacterium]